jgi:YlmC/YmxH family sporulation protein
MSIISTSELRKKEIINMCDGARLGCASDFEFDTCSAVITGLILKNNNGFLGLGSMDRVVIPWCKIECIGEDTILVRFSSNELDKYIKKRKRVFDPE